MTHIDRLLKSARHPRTRELLSAGLRDEPPRGSLARVAAGLGVTLGSSTWSALAAGAGSTASAASGGSAAGATLTLLGAGKLLAIGALAGTLFSGAGVAIQRVRAPHSTASSTTRHVATPPELGTPRSVESDASSQRAARAETPAESRPTTRTTEAARAAPSSSNDSGALAAEVARIDAARSALSSGDTEGALAALAAYQRERRLGVLDREAALLTIRAHAERGETARARELSRRYLAAHPDDAHAPRLRALLEQE